MKKFLQKLSHYDTIFNRMIVAFIALVIVIIVFLNALLLSQFSIRYNSKVQKIEEDHIEILAQNLENLLTKTNGVMVSISNPNNKEKDVMRLFDTSVPNKYYSAGLTQTYLSYVRAQNDGWIESIEFYSTRNDLVISTGSGITYPNQDIRDQAVDDGIFSKETSFHDFRRWIASRVVRTSTGDKEVYSFTAGYPLYTKVDDKFKGYIVVDIKKSAIDGLMEENISGEYSAIGIAREGEAPVATFGNPDSMAEYKEGKDVITISHKIGDGEWSVIEVLSKKEFFYETKEILGMCLVLSVLVIMAGVGMSYLFAKKIYKPFYLIMNKLDKNKVDERARENEYYYIERAIEELQEKTKTQEETINLGMESMKKDFLNKLLFGKLHEKTELLEEMKVLGVEVQGPFSEILLIKLHKKVYAGLTKTEINHIMTVIVGFFNDYADTDLRMVASEISNGNVAVLISGGGDIKEQMVLVRKRLIDYIKVNYLLDLITFESEVFQDLMEAGNQYALILQADAYLYFRPQVYHFDIAAIKDDLINKSEDIDPNYDSFAEALVQRDVERVDAVVKNFVETEHIMRIPTEVLHGIILKYVFIYNYYIRDIKKDNSKADNNRLYTEINALYDLEDFYFWFMELVKRTFSAISEMEDNPKNTAIKLIEDVIRDNLSNESLSLDFIAEKVYLSPKYISRIFKEEKGVKMTEYITDCKLEKAKELLLDTNMNLEELITQVGFSSSNYFIKKFKEKYYITPTQYRRNSVSEN